MYTLRNVHSHIQEGGFLRLLFFFLHAHHRTLHRLDRLTTSFTAFIADRKVEFTQEILLLPSPFLPIPATFYGMPTEIQSGYVDNPARVGLGAAARHKP